MNQKYRIGDVFSMPKPAGERIRLRVREVVKVDCWDGPQYALQLYSKLIGIERWGWFDRGHDRFMTEKQIDENQLTLVERAPYQMSLFSLKTETGVD